MGKDGQRENRDLEKYKENEAKRLKVLYDWKFSEFALDKKQTSSSSSSRSSTNHAGQGHNTQSMPTSNPTMKNMPRNSIRTSAIQSHQKVNSHHRASKHAYAKQPGSSRSISSRVVNKR